MNCFKSLFGNGFPLRMRTSLTRIHTSHSAMLSTLLMAVLPHPQDSLKDLDPGQFPCNSPSCGSGKRPGVTFSVGARQKGWSSSCMKGADSLLSAKPNKTGSVRVGANPSTSFSCPAGCCHGCFKGTQEECPHQVPLVATTRSRKQPV